MILEIKNVKECKNKAWGNFTILGKEKMLITISLKCNKYLADYASTILHEMLHAWVTILRVNGVRVTNLKEHRFIYAVERKILAELKFLRRAK
jgi:hypothetical protein